MRTKLWPPFIRSGFVAGFFLLTSLSQAATMLISPSRYGITEGVDFTLGNSVSAAFLLNWADPDRTTWTNLADPTLVLTLGQTYTFQRISSAHPFVIMNNSAAAFMSGTDGAFSRTTTDPAVIAAAVLSPAVDYTANPGTPGNKISWTPDTLGTFWYTCQVASHTAMAGKISVVPEPSILGLVALGLIFVAFGRHFTARFRAR